MALSIDLYTKKNNKFPKFTKNRLLYSIDVKNTERQFLRTQIKSKKIFPKKYLKKIRKFLMSSQRRYKKKINFQTKFRTITKYYYNLIAYYYKIWNFKQYSSFVLKKYIKLNNLNTFVTPQFFQLQLSRNYHSYYFFLFARHENDKYKINNKLYLKTFISKLQKNWIKSSKIYSYFKYFKRFAFNQKFLLFYYFDVNYCGVKHDIKSRFLKKSINFLIKNNQLKTLKLLKFYKRKVKSKRTFRKR